MRRSVVGWLACTSMVLFTACGGGGGGGGGGGSGGNPTPLPNQLCDTTNQICISVDQLILHVGETVPFTVTTKTPSGGVASGVQVVITDGAAVEVSPDIGTTDSTGHLSGVVEGRQGGSALVTASMMPLPDAPSVGIRMSVQGAPPSPTGASSNTPGGPGTPTPTPMTVSEIKTIYMETSPFTISSQNGGTVDVYAIAFDADNRPVNDVNLLFDFAPKVGTLQPITTRTTRVLLPNGDLQEGVAHVRIVVPAGMAPPGSVTVTASANEIEGRVSFNIAAGGATVTIATVLAQISDATCGNDIGGSVTVNAIVFDADNRPIDNVNVLFITPVGEVIPLTAVTQVSNGQAGTAQTTLQIPPGAPVLVDDVGNILPYTITARAGGVEGSVQLFVVPGREECRAGSGPTTMEGDAASVTLSASPSRIRLRGSGARETSSIVATVFDNQGARLNNAEVRFSLTQTSAGGAVLLPVNLLGGYCSEPIGEVCETAADCALDATCEVSPANRFINYSDRAGNAQIQVRSGDSLGTATVIAEIPSELGEEFTQPCTNPRVEGQRCIISNGIVVTVTAGLPERLSVTVNDASIDNNDGTRLTTITAIVTDTGGNTVENGTPVSFTVVPFTPDDDVSRRVGIVGFPVTNAAPPCDIAQFTQQTGIPVTAQPGNSTTCLTFPLSQSGTDLQVQVESGGVTSLRTVTLPGSIQDLIALANPSTVVVTDTAAGSSVITAIVRDSDGNPVRNARIIFETPLGSFGNVQPPILTSARTDGNGIATATLTIPAGTPAQDIKVLVYGGGVSRVFAAQVPLTIDSTAQVPGAGPQSITLDSADPEVIGVKSSGRPDQSVVSVVVRDRLNDPVAGVPVTFFVNGAGGVDITPTQSVSDEDGIARTTVVAGTLATAVQITAAVDVNSDGIFEVVNQFTPVNIVGGAPSASRFSLAAEFANIAGRVTFGLEDGITAFLNDHFGNAVAPGTAVNFITNGASVFSQVTTDQAGRAGSTLISEGGVADNGIVGVLATTRGEEAFIDSNGNGTHDPDEPFTYSPEPFIDFNGNGRFDPPEPFTDQNGNQTWDEGEPFTDTNANGRYDANAEERFVDVNGNGVWDAAQTPGVWDANALISTSIDITFSAHTQVLLDPPTFTIADGGSQQFTLVVADRDLNPLVGGSTIDFALVGDGARIVGVPPSVTLPDAESFGALLPGLNTFTFFVVDTAEGAPATPQNLELNVSVTSQGVGAQGGNGSVFVSSLGSLLPPPTGTPAATPTTTPTFTVTPTPTETLTPSVTAAATGTTTATQTDTATATTTPSVTGTPPPTGTATATATPTLPAASVAFVNAVPTAIGVRASGLVEQAVLSFRVTDVTAHPVPNVTVTFETTGIGGESLSPVMAMTDNNGLVSTTLTGGTLATSVQVFARVDANNDGTPDLSAQSTAVAILGAPPVQTRFSLAPTTLNIAGRLTLGLEDQVGVFVNDRFGNAVPPGTAISLVTNGASIVDPTTTGTNGVATATLISEGQIPPTGIVTITAFTRGEEGFLDHNGNGRFDAGVDTISTDNVFEPFIDFRPLPPLDAGCSLPAPSPFCNSAFDPGTPFEFFHDTNGNSVWDTQGTSGVWDNNILISDTTTVTFSGPLAAPSAQPDDGQPTTGFIVPDGGSLSFSVLVHDDLVNPLVGGSAITVTANGGQVVGGAITVPDGQSYNQLVDGLTRFHFTLVDPDTGAGGLQPVTVTIQIASDNGNITTIIGQGSLQVPPPTPTAPPSTPTAPASTPTATP